MFNRIVHNMYTCDIAITQNQQKYLVNQVISQLTKFYQNKDSRRMVLNAFTGSGKTTVALKVLIPEFVKKFYSQNKRVIVFMAPRVEVVEQSYQKAKKALNNKIISGTNAVVKTYNSDQINDAKKEISNGEQVSLSGDVIVLFLTSQYFNQNYDLLTKDGDFDLVIVDEAHIMFGTISKEDTKADKGATNNKFIAHTLDKLSSLTSTAVLFLTATPTNSQCEKTDLGKTHNVYLEPMPRDPLTAPFFDIVAYNDSKDAVVYGLDYFKSHCDNIIKLMTNIKSETWDIAKEFKPQLPAILVRLARRGSTNGADFNKTISSVKKFCKTHNYDILINTSESFKKSINAKEYNSKKISSLVEGIEKAELSTRPVVIVVIESAYCGLDLPKLNNVIIAGDPSGTIHNNYSQTAGRAARMKFFIDHTNAINAIKNYNISDKQRRLLAEYYILHSTSMVHVPVSSELLNGDVKNFIETETFRGREGSKFVLDSIFGTSKGPRLVTKTMIINNDHDIHKKDYCEACDVEDNVTVCFNEAWRGLSNVLKIEISFDEMKSLWKKCLQVHHMDGDHHNNSDINNLKTLCPNVHSAITMQNCDYNNRYTELRDQLFNKNLFELTN